MVSVLTEQHLTGAIRTERWLVAPAAAARRERLHGAVGAAASVVVDHAVSPLRLEHRSSNQAAACG